MNLGVKINGEGYSLVDVFSLRYFPVHQNCLADRNRPQIALK